MNRPHVYRLAFLLAALALPPAFAETDGNPPPDAKKGRAVYKASCALCHEKGVNGAPRLGHAEDWKNRQFEWQPLMEKHASNGYLKMPAKGYTPNLGEQDVANAVFYMTQKLRTTK